MAMAMALIKLGLDRENSQQSPSSCSVQTRVIGTRVREDGRDRMREDNRPRGENKMLRLHENLSTSLYKNKDRSNEKLSVKIVLLISLFATLATGTFTHMYNPLLILFYLLFIWILPMWSYTLGVKKKNSFLLIPWIFVFFMHGVVVELFLLGAACETLAVHLIGSKEGSIADSGPIIVISGTILDFLFLVFLSIPLPILLSVPVKAFVYMDINRRRQHSSHNTESSLSCQYGCCCCQKTKEDVIDSSAEVSEHSDVDEEAPDENSSSAQSSSLIITRFQRLNQQHNIITTVIRERLDEVVTNNNDDTVNTEVVQETPIITADPSLVAIARFPSLYDLGSISEDVVESEGIDMTTEDEHGLPPSYSQAEGLDQLPSYSEVDVSRMRIGPYVMVYDKEHKNVLTFKK